MSKKTKTGVILGAVRMGLGEIDAQTGSSPGSAVHPLAGTAWKQDFPSNGANALRPLWVQANGTARATVGEALVVGDPGTLSANVDRVMEATDHYSGHRANGDLPLLYGVQRSQIGVLGATSDWIDGYRRLPPLGSGYDNGTKLNTPYDATIYSDALFRYRAALPPRKTLDAANTEAVQYALQGKLAELTRLGAIATSAEPDESTSWVGDARDRASPVAGSWDDFHRVWMAGVLGVDPKDPDEPGSYYNRPQPGRYLNDTHWMRYRIRGLNVYDAYGSEIIYYLDPANNAVRLLSAGPDGVLKFHYGRDKIYQTDAHDDVVDPDSDDKDGIDDNILASGEEQ